jgi:NADH:ubiquinone oxidoreductase subunit 3 (subunit A)
MFLQFSKKLFFVLVLILGIFLIHITLKTETTYNFKNQDYGKYIRYECVTAPCGGWGKKLTFLIANLK